MIIWKAFEMQDELQSAPNVHNLSWTYLIISSVVVSSFNLHVYRKQIRIQLRFFDDMSKEIWICLQNETITLNVPSALWIFTEVKNLNETCECVWKRRW